MNHKTLRCLILKTHFYNPMIIQNVVKSQQLNRSKEICSRHPW